MKIVFYLGICSLLLPSMSLAQELPDGSIRAGLGYEQNGPGVILGEELSAYNDDKPYRIVSGIPQSCFHGDGITSFAGHRTFSNASDPRSHVFLIAVFGGQIPIECGEDRVVVEPVVEVFFEESGWEVLNVPNEGAYSAMLRRWGSFNVSERDRQEMVVSEDGFVSFVKTGTNDASYMCMVNGAKLLCAFDSKEEVDRDNLQHALIYKGYEVQDVDISADASDRRTGVTMGEFDTDRPFSSIAKMMKSAVDIELLGVRLNIKRMEISFGDRAGSRWRERITDETFRE